MNKSTKGLRFAPIIRVSTEKAEKRGESLQVQKDTIIHIVENFEGTIPDCCWKYSGQEHATPEHERKKLDQILEDSGKGLFDAVIVTDASRWSRNNLKSSEGLEILKANGIRFFDGGSERDLFDPTDSYILAMGVAAAEHSALLNQKKAILSRISKAKQGYFASYPLPYGRVKDPKGGGKLTLDPEKEQKINSAAERFLNGLSLEKAAKSIGMSKTNLRKTFLEKCGDVIDQNFNDPRFKIHEKIPTNVPRLLPQEKIDAIKAKFEANKRIYHGHIKHRYLLSRMIVCAECGGSFFGLTDKNGKKYYKHRSSDCIGKKSLLAERLEKMVLLSVFSAFGDKRKIEQAVKDAIPDQKEIKQLTSRRRGIEKDLAKIEAKKNNVVRAIGNGTVTETDAKGVVQEYNDQINLLNSELVEIKSRLEQLPQEAEINKKADFILSLKKKYFKTLHHLNNMPFEDRRALLQAIFENKKLNGKRPGVYLKRGKNWTFTIKGALIPEKENPLKKAKGYVPKKKINGYVPKSSSDQLDYARAMLGYGEEDDPGHLKQFLANYKQKTPLLQDDPPLCFASVLSFSWDLHLNFSLNIETTGSHVPHKSLTQSHAIFTPEAV
jgi:site-specific DNA recombinase